MKALRVGIDGGALRRPETGIGRYTDQLLRSLVATFPRDEWVVFSTGRLAEGAVPADVAVRSSRVPGRILRGLWGSIGWPPLERFTGAVDVFHTSDWGHPPQRSGGIVTTVHDLGPLYHPEWYAPDIGRIHQRQNEATARRATRIIAISEFTRQRFLERFPVEPERVVVVPHGVGPEFRPPEPESVRRVTAAHGIDGPYLLYVGTREPRKNVSGLARIFERVAARVPEVLLVLVGLTGSEPDDSIHGSEAWSGDPLDGVGKPGVLRPRVRVLGKVPREDLVSLYGGAVALCFPTLYEGFGLPLLEAMACGCPVVTSDLTSVPEVVGAAGMLCDPLDEEGFADGVLRVIDDDALRARLSADGVERARGYTWDRTARQTRVVYELAAEAAR